MRHAILGDIHSNWEALTAVLADAEKNDVERFISVGDVVGYNANPRECLEKVRELDCPIVKGNHDHYCSMDTPLTGFNPLAASVIHWTRNHLSLEERDFLADLPFKRRVESYTIVHSTLDMPDKWGYVFDKFEAASNFSYQNTSVCFFGHTHVPLAFERADNHDIAQGTYNLIEISAGKKYFINIGSVGQPRDGDSRAAYAIYDIDAKTIELRRIEYDIETTQKKIIDAGLPRELAQRLASGY